MVSSNQIKVGDYLVCPVIDVFGVVKNTSDKCAFSSLGNLSLRTGCFCIKTICLMKWDVFYKKIRPNA